MNYKELSLLYRKIHNLMRNIDGLHPNDAFDEFLKILFFKENYELEKDKDININSVKIRKYFKYYVEQSPSWIQEMWMNKKFNISDNTLLSIYEILEKVNLTKLDLDIRNLALREFLNSDLRKGLGIFLTPNEITNFIAEYISKIHGDNKKLKILDVACGSGTFLIDALKYFNLNEVYGFEKVPKMLMLAKLNFVNQKNIVFNSKLVDTLTDIKLENEFDIIMTNPPFGVEVDSRFINFNEYEVCKDKEGYVIKKQYSELLFLEKALKLLKPGGTLGIVLPKSIGTNLSLEFAREKLNKYGYIHTIVTLPSETFAPTGTQTNTIILFIKKYRNKEDSYQNVTIPMVDIKNIGYDYTGRKKEGNQLSTLVQDLINSDNKIIDKSIKYIEIKKNQTFSHLSKILLNLYPDKSINISTVKEYKLKDLVEYIGTGKTPARKEYTESGYFILKVGNLTNYGINWEPRERNFISKEEINKRLNSSKILILKKYDILLTSSAHNPSYIAKKSDIFLDNPSYIKDSVTFSGELMLIRTNKIDPFILLAIFKLPFIIENIQKLVRGQTAHLHSEDLKNFSIPKDLLKNKSIKDNAILLEEKSKLSEKINYISHLIENNILNIKL